jgi:class 3 adenylate cyclase/tetratricopeptide (TPR) repeat protein
MALCSECGTANTEGMKFCGECGSPLGERWPAREERRVVTVLFADVVGFTSRSESLDIEDVGAFLAPFHRIATEQVERFGGVVAKFIGDGVMALFGAPVAHEDDSERAVRAALAVQQQLETLREERPQLALHVRIGITTGQVLLRFGDDGRVDGVGDAVNTAARLESAAPVDGVLVGARTRSATAGRIEYDEVAPVQAKGKSRPLAAAVARGSRRDAREAPATPFVGRSEEREQLWSRFTGVCDARRAATVVVVGPPGAGKSRLVHELRRRVEQGQHPAWWQKGRSAAFPGGAALWPLAEIVKLQSGVLDDDTAAVAIAKLDAGISALIGDRDEADWVVRALRPLLGLSDAGDAPVDHSEAAAAWRAFAHALARSRPTVLLFEDLHWADDATLELVRGLADDAELPLLVLVTARPELLDRWHDPAAAATLIDLQPMAGGEVTALAGAVLGGEVSDELRAMLVERAAGNPLFAQEDARMLMESGLLVTREGRWTIDAWDDLELPDTVQGIIGARLDRLAPDERSLIGDAAVVAAGIGPEALAYMSGTPPGVVAGRLATLERAGLLRPAVDSTAGPGKRFAFTHVLIRDCAYERMVRGQRAARHERAAEWFEHVQEDRDQLLEVVADHYLQALQYRKAGGEDCAELIARARGPIRDAGRRANALGAFPTALRLLEQAVELWPQPDADRGAVLLDYGESQLGAGVEGEVALREAVELLTVAGEHELLADAQVSLTVLLYRRGDMAGSETALTSAYEAVRDATPSRTKTSVLGLVARAALERGEADRSLRLAREAEATAEAVEGIPFDVVAYAGRQVGLAEIALGDLDESGCCRRRRPTAPTWPAR